MYEELELPSKVSPIIGLANSRSVTWKAWLDCLKNGFGEVKLLVRETILVILPFRVVGIPFMNPTLP